MVRALDTLCKVLVIGSLDTLCKVLVIGLFTLCKVLFYVKLLGVEVDVPYGTPPTHEPLSQFLLYSAVGFLSFLGSW